MAQQCQCSCSECAPEELTLDNGKKVQVSGLRRTFLRFQGLGMPCKDMVADLLAARIRPQQALAAVDEPRYKAALLREYTRFCQPPELADPAAQTPAAAAKVEIFSKPGCPYTRGLKHKLEHDGIAYVEYDVQSNPPMLRRMLELNGGQRNVPTVRNGDQVTVGFHGT
jgi:glutaredoxin